MLGPYWSYLDHLSINEIWLEKEMSIEAYIIQFMLKKVQNI